MKNIPVIAMCLMALLLYGCSPLIERNDSIQNSVSDTLNSIIYVRKNANTPAAEADLNALSFALSKMRLMGCENPLSWYYQGATHSIPNKIDNGNPLCPSYISAVDSKLKWGWATCTHKEGSELHFLIWHRIYISHLEAIVRKISGKADFALPYWNYINKDERIMPAKFREENNGLYSAARLYSLNKGQRIEDFMDKFLDVEDLMEERVYSEFNETIDGAPHGVMHGYIGGGFEKGKTMWNPIFQNDKNYGLMNQVESAGFDPIFWMHHSNIDRLWQQWENSPNGSRPELRELEAKPWPYHFFTPNGKEKIYTVEEAYNSAMNPDYVYDEALAGVSKLNSPIHKILLERNKRHVKELVFSEDITNGIVNDRLIFRPSNTSINKISLLNNESRVDAMVLELTTVFTKQPHAAYSVYVIDSQGDKHTAGILTFFGAAHHAGAHQHGNMRIIKKFSFDLTDELKVGEKFSIVIEKGVGTKNDLTIESLQMFIY
jgi:hypothetical protein